jgi:hypothetical protein
MIIANRIREKNTQDTKDPVMTDDTMFRNHMADIVESKEVLETYLKILQEGHFIFRFTIVEPDERLRIAGIFGYVHADLNVIRKVKEFAFRQLELFYEGQFYQRKSAHALVREMVGQARQHNNTPFGKVLNISVMIEQLEHVVELKNNEYQETWRKNKMNELLPGLEEVFDKTSKSTDVSDSASDDLDINRRAIDHPSVEQLETMNMDGSWGRAVETFGVEFLVRVHFRKHEFDVVRRLIKRKQISREADLKFIRDTLRLLEVRANEDMLLKPWQQEITETRRLAQLKLNQIFTAKKEF